MVINNSVKTLLVGNIVIHKILVGNKHRLHI